jgi:hypothetical protein
VKITDWLGTILASASLYEETINRPNHNRAYGICLLNRSWTSTRRTEVIFTISRMPCYWQSQPFCVLRRLRAEVLLGMSPPNGELLEGELPLSLSRRARKKSKGGCKACKLRKVKVGNTCFVFRALLTIKCDETRPVCGKCRVYYSNRVVACDYDAATGLGLRRKPLCLIKHSHKSVAPPQNPQGARSFLINYVCRG